MCQGCVHDPHRTHESKSFLFLDHSDCNYSLVGNSNVNVAYICFQFLCTLVFALCLN